jgi:hypothetical protein
MPRPDQVQIGNYVTIRVKTADAVAASRDIGAGAAGVRYVEDTAGGAAPGIAHINPGVANAALDVSVVGDDITVTLGNTATAGTISSTAAQVRDAVNADPDASALVTASLLGDGTGTAVAAAMADLTGGSDAVYTELYGERDHSRSDEREGIDASHKGAEHAITIPGRRSGSISLTLVANRVDVIDDPSQPALRDIYEAGTAVLFREVKTFPGAAADGSQDVVQEAEGVLLSFSESASDNEVVTIDAELTLNTPLTAVA